VTKPGSGLRELEKRLVDDPDNLGLRVKLASAMRDAGRQAEAVELYRSVAIAYRDQGRAQQAIAVCRSILELAPDDLRCHALIGSLGAGHHGDPAALAAPVRRSSSSFDETPLPHPLPYHEADPTTLSHEKISDPALPMAEGLASRLGESLDLSAELETRQRPRIDSSELDKISGPPPTAPVERIEFDESLSSASRDTSPSLGMPSFDQDPEDELTTPRELPEPPELPATRHPIPSIPGGSSTGALLSSAFFSPLPPARRGAVLGRFHRRHVPAGSTVIRQGETDHALVIVGRGRLEVHVEREDGQTVLVTGIGIGEYIGEVGLLGRIPSPAHVVATLDCELLELPAREFYSIVGAFPSLWAELKEVAERRTRELHAKITR